MLNILLIAGCLNQPLYLASPDKLECTQIQGIRVSEVYCILGENCPPGIRTVTPLDCKTLPDVAGHHILQLPNPHSPKSRYTALRIGTEEIQVKTDCPSPQPQLKLVTDKSIYMAGEPIRFTFTNSAPKPIQILQGCMKEGLRTRSCNIQDPAVVRSLKSKKSFSITLPAPQDSCHEPVFFSAEYKVGKNNGPNSVTTALPVTVLGCYDSLRTACKEDGCCLGSVDAMERQKGIPFLGKGPQECAPPLKPNMLKCPSSLRWCYP